MVEVITGSVAAVHPESWTYDVVLENGGTVYNIGLMNSYGGPFSVDVCPIPDMLGASVALIRLLGKWYILGTLPTHTKPSVQLMPSTTNTETSTDNEDTYGAKTVKNGVNYTAGRNTSILPGDKYMCSEGGSELLLGTEGLVVLKAAPLAQIILGGFRDFGKIVARDLTIDTDFGEMKFSHGGSGSTCMSILGGSTFCDESGTNDPIYTFKMYAGDVPGDPLARFAILVDSADRSEYAYIYVDKSGKLSVELSKDEDRTIGRDQTTEITENRTTTIHVNDTLSVDGDSSTTIGGESTCSIGGSNSLSIGGDSTVSVTGSSSETATVSKSLTSGLLSIKTGAMTIACSSLNITKV